MSQVFVNQATTQATLATSETTALPCLLINLQRSPTLC